MSIPPADPILPHNPCNPSDQFDVLGVAISAINLDDAVRHISCWIEDHSKAYVVLTTVYTIMRAFDDPTLRARINHATMVTPDGMPLVFMARLMGHRNVDRVYGPDLLLAISQVAVNRGYRCYFYGGNASSAAQCSQVIVQRFPGLQVVGSYSPPIREMGALEENAIIAEINAAAPDIIWVGLGSPKQDQWMADHREKLDAPVLIGIGAAFDFFTGRIPHAPRWIQRSGFEWLFRLISEPRRLWRRYVIHNPRFVFHAVLQLLGLRRYPR